MEEDSIKKFLENLKDNDRIKPSLPIQKRSYRKWVIKLAFGLAALSVAYFGFTFYKNYKITRLDNNQNLISRVIELVELNSFEQPTVATVTNSDLLSKQIFFTEAKVGDKLLVFKTNKKAVLYRSSTDKVVSIAPLN